MNAISWCVENYAKLNLPDIGFTTFTNCVSDDLKHLDTTAAYREYYRLYKKDILKYTKRSVPMWVQMLA